MLQFYLILIKPEEIYLFKMFGKEYQEYKNIVGIWFGRKKKRPTTAST
jgi:protein-S-isoprenylcysteine O-methyltransferase Ste14